MIDSLVAATSVPVSEDIPYADRSIFFGNKTNGLPGVSLQNPLACSKIFFATILPRFTSHINFLVDHNLDESLRRHDDAEGRV